MNRPLDAAQGTLRIAVLADRMCAQRFAIDVIDEIAGCDSIAVFSCTNTRLKRRPARHAAYYALNLIAMRNRLARMAPLSSTRKRIERVVEFESEYEGAWQRLPDSVVEELATSGFDLIFKAGMGLMRVPPPEQLPVPILSFHHGDPSLYRGRPAGFWEIVDRRPVIGQVVQLLSNELDAGKVVAFGETKVYPHSYRATLIEAYGHSKLLINQAIRNALEGRSIELGPKGRNCRLPSNGTVARFAMKTAAELAKRLWYGATIQKRWRISTAPLQEIVPERLVQRGALPDRSSWRTVEPAKGYVFYADPFFSRDPHGILVEALSARSGLGEILLVHGPRHERVSAGTRHFSYPATLTIGGEQFLLPETANWSEPAWYRIANGRMELHGSLKVENGCRIVDPTPFEHGGRIYVFGNRKHDGAHALRLWSAEEIDADFGEHPMSPIRISPRGGRMAGAILRAGGRLLRFGQDFERGYGNGIVAFEILDLSATGYSEREIGRVRFDDCSGPHTLNWSDGELLFDWYDECFAPLAGLRRIRGRLRAR